MSAEHLIYLVYGIGYLITFVGTCIAITRSMGKSIWESEWTVVIPMVAGLTSWVGVYVLVIAWHYSRKERKLLMK